MKSQKEFDQELILNAKKAIAGMGEENEMTSELLLLINDTEKSASEKPCEVDRIGTTIRITEYDGTVHKFKDFLPAIEFLNNRKLVVYNLSGLPQRIWDQIDPELLRIG